MVIAGGATCSAKQVIASRPVGLASAQATHGDQPGIAVPIVEQRGAVRVLRRRNPSRRRSNSRPNPVQRRQRGYPLDAFVADSSPAPAPRTGPLFPTRITAHHREPWRLQIRGTGASGGTVQSPPWSLVHTFQMWAIKRSGLPYDSRGVCWRWPGGPLEGLRHRWWSSMRMSCGQAPRSCRTRRTKSRRRSDRSRLGPP